jgi:hypothetical protein
MSSGDCYFDLLMALYLFDYHQLAQLLPRFGGCMSGALNS